MNTRNFWNRVKICIKEKGITQEETAKACKFPYSNLRLIPLRDPEKEFHSPSPEEAYFYNLLCAIGRT